MTNNERIDLVISTLKETWLLAPNLRLCQLLENLKPNEYNDLFYLSDMELVSLLDSFKQNLTTNEHKYSKSDLISSSELQQLLYNTTDIPLDQLPNELAVAYNDLVDTLNDNSKPKSQAFTKAGKLLLIAANECGIDIGTEIIKDFIKNN